MKNRNFELFKLRHVDQWFSNKNESANMQLREFWIQYIADIVISVPKKWWKLPTDKWNTSFLSGKEVGVSEWATVPCSVRIAGEGQPMATASCRKSAGARREANPQCWLLTPDPNTGWVNEGLTTNHGQEDDRMTRRLYVRVRLKPVSFLFVNGHLKLAPVCGFFWHVMSSQNAAFVYYCPVVWILMLWFLGCFSG